QPRPTPVLAAIHVVVDERLPLGQAGGVPQIAEHDLVALASVVDGATGGQKRKAGFELLTQRTASTVDDRAQAPIEPELTMMLTDEVDHRQVRLVLGATQTATELLREDRRAIGRSEQQHRIHARYVDTLAKHID